ncbi:MAG: hypothetical protein ABJA80_01925 [bacterium]
MVAIVAVVVAQWAAFPYLVGVFHDDGIYALLARSIASGDGFHYSHLPGAPAAVHYPPLYPLLLAAAWRLAPAFPANVPVLLGLNVALVAAASVGWFCFATHQLDWRTTPAAVLALVATLASPMLALAGALLSEPLFLALLWPALLLAERAARSPDARPVYGAGFAIGILMLVRTHALALLVGLVFVLAWRRRWRHACAAVGAAVLVQLPWLLWARAASPHVAAPLEGAYGSYGGWFLRGVQTGGFPFVTDTVRTNLGEAWLLLGDRMAMGLPATLHSVAVLAALLAAVSGGALLRHRAPVTVTFLLAYLAVVFVWPYSPWRFLWLVWPVLVLCISEGVRLGWTRGGRWRPVVALAAALPAVAYVRTELHAYASRAWRAPARQAAAQIVPVIDWVRTHTAPGDVVLGEGEQVIALYAGRRAAPPLPFTAREYVVRPDDATEQAGLRAMLAAVPARYVVTLLPATLHAARTVALTGQGLREIGPVPQSNAVAFEVVR